MTDPAVGTATEADLIHDAVLQVGSIAGLSSGAMGEIASYLPGRRVAGVRLDDDHVEVHVIAVYGPPIREIVRDIQRVLSPLLRGRRLDVAIEDIVAPGEPVPGDAVPAEPPHPADVTVRDRVP